VPAGKGALTMTTGNASGTELLVDGAVAPPFVGDRSVLRDLPLDPDTIRDGKLPGQAGAQAAGTTAPGGAKPVAAKIN
jgi:hypothetical protein